jgi:uncharacterized protein (DUF2141 family)
MKLPYNKTYITILIAAFLFVSNICISQKVELNIQNLSCAEGFICIAVFTSDKEFKTEKPFYEFKIHKNMNKCDTIKTVISLPPGKYGISVLHDENLNGKMDYNFFGVPIEGFGFSNYYQQKLRKPSFDSFSFNLNKNEKQKIDLTMKYF